MCYVEGFCRWLARKLSRASPARAIFPSRRGHLSWLSGITSFASIPFDAVDGSSTFERSSLIQLDPKTIYTPMA